LQQTHPRRPFVQIPVLLTVEVPASGTIDDVEPMIVAAGQAAMRAAVQVVCREYERQVMSCPRCGSDALQSEGTDERRLRTSFGRVLLVLRRLRCEGCGDRFRPADTFVATLGGVNITARLRAACVLAGSSWPYQTAALVLRTLCGAEVGAESVRRLTNAAGQIAARDETTAAARLIAPPAGEIRAEREAARREPRASAAAPAHLLVGLDGGWVPSRDQPGGMEGKVGVVATEVEPVGRHGRHRLVRRRYVATFGDGERVGLLTYAAAHALDGDRAPHQTVLGDGAGWIKTQAALHFPEATTILDWPHLVRAVHKAIRAARPGAANTAVRRNAHQTILDLLWRGDVEGAITALAALPPPDAAPIPAVVQTRTYLHEQRDWIGDYAAWRDAGEPIGSGMVEREVALVINRRMKRQGMRWRRANADAVVALRVRSINQSWNQEAA
jgi:hypothetical protein